MLQAPTGDPGENGTLVWQRAWSIAEMRAGAGNWSLAGDAGVCTIFFFIFSGFSILLCIMISF